MPFNFVLSRLLTAAYQKHTPHSSASCGLVQGHFERANWKSLSRLRICCPCPLRRSSSVWTTCWANADYRW